MDGAVGWKTSALSFLMLVLALFLLPGWRVTEKYLRVRSSLMNLGIALIVVSAFGVASYGQTAVNDQHIAHKVKLELDSDQYEIDGAIDEIAANKLLEESLFNISNEDRQFMIDVLKAADVRERKARIVGAYSYGLKVNVTQQRSRSGASTYSGFTYQTEGIRYASEAVDVQRRVNGTKRAFIEQRLLW